MNKEGYTGVDIGYFFELDSYWKEAQAQGDYAFEMKKPIIFLLLQVIDYLAKKNQQMVIQLLAKLLTLNKSHIYKNA